MIKMKVRKIKSITFFENGGVMIFDTRGKQIAGLQYPWIKLFIDHLKDKGYSLPDDITMPNGKKAIIYNFDDGGYNWGWE